jgi:hypothetical protein
MFSNLQISVENSLPLLSLSLHGVYVPWSVTTNVSEFGIEVRRDFRHEILLVPTDELSWSDLVGILEPN